MVDNRIQKPAVLIISLVVTTNISSVLKDTPSADILKRLGGMIPYLLSQLVFV